MTAPAPPGTPDARRAVRRSLAGPGGYAVAALLATVAAPAAPAVAALVALRFVLPVRAGAGAGGPSL